jgi:hypothetical protein
MLVAILVLFEDSQSCIRAYPDGLPLARISNPYYEIWEDIASQLPNLIQTNQIRERIDLLSITFEEIIENSIC